MAVKKFFVVSGMFVCGLLSSASQASDSGLVEPSGKIVDQIRAVLCNVLEEKHLIPEESDSYLPVPNEDGTTDMVPFVSVLKAIGMTDQDIEKGGSILHRLENIFHLTESNSCKLSHIIASMNAFQQEERKNMNTLMEELSNLKEEIFTTKATIYGHDFATQKLLNDTDAAESITALQLAAKTEEMKAALERPQDTDFTEYDYTHPINNCIHSDLYNNDCFVRN